MDAQICDSLLLPFASNVLDRCDAGQLETIVERASLLEFEAGCQPRALAEALAVLDLLRQAPQLLTGVVVLEIEINGATRWVLVLDQEWASAYVESCGGQLIAVHDPATVLRSQYGGVAVLSTFG